MTAKPRLHHCLIFVAGYPILFFFCHIKLKKNIYIFACSHNFAELWTVSKIGFTVYSMLIVKVCVFPEYRFMLFICRLAPLLVLLWPPDWAFLVSPLVISQPAQRPK